jgi:hypothetical protein
MADPMADPNAILTHSSGGGVVMVVSGVLVLWTLLTLGARLYTRFSAKVSLGIDDVLCIAATVSKTTTILGLEDA